MTGTPFYLFVCLFVCLLVKHVGAEMEEEEHIRYFRGKLGYEITEVTKLNQRRPMKNRASNNNNNNNNNNLELQKLQQENAKMRQEIQAHKAQVTELTTQLENIETKISTMDTGEKELRQRSWRQFKQEMEAFEDLHTSEMERLRIAIEDLQCKIEQKNLVEGYFKVGILFDNGFDKENQTDVHIAEEKVAYNDNKGVRAIVEKKEQKYNIDGQLEDYEVDIQQTGPTHKMTYKNLHKHNHVHVLNHRHYHYHNDTSEKELVFTQTETFAHTIVHTSTQFQIKHISKAGADAAFLLCEGSCILDRLVVQTNKKVDLHMELRFYFIFFKMVVQVCLQIYVVISQEQPTSCINKMTKSRMFLSQVKKKVKQCESKKYSYTQ
ncbi:hypothetical protein RFI_08805 [Reticulomyxa filosa]|uniref:Uncharacterized protein n=1 Tax=Reticulomyxa filosa TaxID=46433 RepID=X6NSN6_RETFI|nr:hypothetical protein RFI_08805 [Reticulomyxa filosa]|eukprot:ETO28327.1 hypothetical protein RFI_08805 [Reticulomyxa filosa]